MTNKRKKFIHLFFLSKKPQVDAIELFYNLMLNKAFELLKNYNDKDAIFIKDLAYELKSSFTKKINEMEMENKDDLWKNFSKALEDYAETVFESRNLPTY